MPLWHNACVGFCDRQQEAVHFLCEACQEEQYAYDRPVARDGQLVCQACAGKRDQEEDGMTLRELSPQYRHQAQLLRGRIKELEALQKQSTSTSEKERFAGRIRALSELYREARDLAVLTERYYERGFKRNGRYTL